jgi:peptide/histidine transporter 3/4
MRSVCQALNLLTTTLGYIVAGGINSLFSFWIKKNLNDGHLEYIFYVLAGLVLLNLIGFVYVSQSFQYHHQAGNLPDFSTSSTVTGFSPALPRAAHRILNRIGKFDIHTFIYCTVYTFVINTVSYLLVNGCID